MDPMLDQEDMALRNTAGPSRDIESIMIRSVAGKEDNGSDWAKAAT